MPHGGFLSEVTRMLHIARALQAQGESVCIASHGGPYLNLLAQAGLRCTLLEPHMDRARCRQAVADVMRLAQPGVRLHTPDEVRQAVAAEAAFLSHHGARAVVTGFTLTALLSSRIVGIPLVTTHAGAFVPPVFERGLAPVPTTMPVPGTEWLPDWLKRQLVNQGPLRLTDPPQFLNDIADELGLERVPTLAALLMGDLTLVTELPQVLGIPAVDMNAWRPRRPQAFRPGARLVYTGPLFAQLDLPLPPTVQAFMDRSRPTAYVALSSATPAQVRAAVRRVRAAGLRVIVAATMPGLGLAGDADTVVAGPLPSHRVMPQVNLAVTMGGQGTVQTALASGTPLVGVPLQGEQELNVHLAVRHGAGLAVALRFIDSPRLTEAVQRVATDPRFAAGARQVRDWYAGVDGAGQAARAILDHLVTTASTASAASTASRHSAHRAAA